MSGLLAILGGQEHLPGCEPIDRMLLDESGVTRPTVTVLLAASVPERIRAKVAEADAYWPRLGARVRFAFTGGPDGTAEALDALSDPDLVVLTGGRPWLIQRRLTAPVIERLRQLSDDGVPLSGSSAGAMAMGLWRMDLHPARTPRVRMGMGLVHGLAAPHYGRHFLHHACRVVAHRHPHVPVLGLPDRTALVGRAGRFEVMGVGGATILHHGRRMHHRRGAVVDLGRAPVHAQPVTVAVPEPVASLRLGCDLQDAVAL